MNDAAEKSIAQVAYETFLEEIGKTADADEVHGAPAWEMLPEHVRAVIANAVGAAVRSFAPALIADVSPEEQSFAQVGYQAYVASTGGLNYQGLPCPEWSKLPDAIRAAWAAASVLIRSEHEHRFAAEFDLEVSKDELAELIAGLDALQRADKHQAELTFPLRSRLRGMLFPPADDAPAPESSPEIEFAATDSDDAPNSGGAATESTGDERSDPETKTDPSPALPPAESPPELPVVSAAPPAPGLPGLEPVIPGPPAMPTDIGPPPSPTARADDAPAPDDVATQPDPAPAPEPTQG